MRQKIGKVCMILGALLILASAVLLAYNKWDASRADKAAQQALGELEPTQIEKMTTKTEDSDAWDLTLFTCTTGGSARCAVRCVRTGYPTLTTETAAAAE